MICKGNGQTKIFSLISKHGNIIAIKKDIEKTSPTNICIAVSSRELKRKILSPSGLDIDELYNKDKKK